jgi:hypothetical protein
MHSIHMYENGTPILAEHSYNFFNYEVTSLAFICNVHKYSLLLSNK